MPRVSSDEGRVYQFIINAGERGATDDELEAALKLTHQNASARRRGLVQRGRVMDSGVKRKTRSGRLAAVWVVATEGRTVEPRRVLPRPSKQTLYQAAIEIATLARMVGEENGGYRPPRELVEAVLWLSEGAVTLREYSAPPKEPNHEGPGPSFL